MTLFFNKPENRNYAKLGNVEKSGSDIDFSEGYCTLSEDKCRVDLWLFAESVTDIKKSGDNNFKYESQVVNIGLTIAPYEVTYQDKVTKKEPTPYTQFLGNWLLANFPNGKDSPFNGVIKLNQISETSLMKLLDLDAKSSLQELDDKQKFMFETYFEMIGTISKCALTQLVNFTPDSPNSKSSGYSTKYQSPSERLEKLFLAVNSDNFMALITQLSSLDDAQKSIALEIIKKL